MNIANIITIIIIAGILHASFQLSVSVVTLLSSHTIGRQRSRTKLLGLLLSYLGGVVLMTLLCLSLVTILIASIVTNYPSLVSLFWITGCGLVIGLGVSIWLFYYRRGGEGTSLWLPRGLSSYLTSRTKTAKSNIEAFSLGLISVVAELVFTIAPLSIASLALMELPMEKQFIGLAIYSLIACLPVIVVVALVNGGHPISRIQRWRETNRRFIQFTSGAGFIILGFYLYADKVAATYSGLIEGWMV